jgi:hypothetical protein
MTRGAADQSGVGDCGEADLWNVSRAGVNTLAVPDRLARFGKEISQKSAAIGGCEYSGVAPLIIFQRSYVEYVNDEDIAWFRAGDFDRSNKMMARGKITVAYIGGVIVILDLTASPIQSFDDEIFPRLYRHHGRNVWMPSVV